ncbi:Heat shock 70 kDa protein 12B [Leucoagaricus sp. SymC.cos]|nr:Heat shock 70 kDa protein 12B [Leucoagaricus sp. SymC.cos]
MGCCGEPVDKVPSNRAQQSAHGIVTTQPGAQPILEKPGNTPPITYQPTVASPPPAVINHAPVNNFNNLAAPPWGQSPSPPVQHPYEFGAMAPSPPIPSPSPGTFTTSTYNPNGAADPLLRPQTAYYPSLNGRAGTLTPNMSPPPIDLSNVSVPDEGKMSVSVDFGTTFSGVAYGSSRIAGGRVQQILNWPGSVETYRKIPTCLLYDEHGQVIAWGLEAKNASPMTGTLKCEWFKLFLEPKALRDESAIDHRLPLLPPGKRAIDLIIDFLSCLWEHAKEQITRDIGAVADLNSADVLLTVPAAWDAKGCDMMREAAIQAGLVQSARAGDKNWRDRLRIITEPEAAAVHCAHLSDLHHLKPSQNFIVCDAGGGTVDLAAYKIIGQMAHLEIAEMCARSGANCGSLFLDLRFRELVKTLLADHPAHLDPASLAYFMHSFSETDKHNYAGIQDDDLMFHFHCFNTEDPQDPTVGLINGELCIPGNLLRREVFDPVVNEVLQLIEEQMSRIEQRIDALLLVGGFAGSEYLRQRVQEQFGSRIHVIARPPDADTATLRGAAQYGLARRPLVASVIAPRAYIMKVKLPAEQEDWLKRPAYIRSNDAGINICENRLQYLVSKGAILRKGQRLSTKFCKFSKSAQDSTFVATLYTSEANMIMRYTDEGETTELCKWTVDLSSLPSFRNNGATQAGGFYTEFELGLELDSAEVRGILLYNNQEWGRVTFDFLN